MTPPARLALVLVGCLLALVDVAGAQERRGGSPPATLAAVEAALDSGRVERARSGLRAWREGPGRRAGRSARNHATFLRARLSTDPDSAESLYLDVALSGDPEYGDDAWLRLAQLHLARGEPERASAELERLRTDYPDSELLDASRRWSAVADSAAGQETPPAAAVGEERPTGGAFAVQLGAFSERARAEEVARRARDLGFRVRVVGPAPGDGLFRVRTGALESRRAASDRARRIRERGLAAIVVERDGGGDR